MGMKVNGSSGLVFPDSTTMTTGSQAVRAWVNFNGTGTVAIRASFNVSSITDNGTGDYTVNFTTALQDANYAASVGSLTLSGAGLLSIGYGAAPTASAYRTLTFSFTTGGSTDSAYMFLSFFR
jgi:hypothetical protein